MADRARCELTCSLNHAGRLQLLKSVLFSIQAFWTSHFILPKAVLKQLQSLFLKFLWGGSSANSKLIKVSWEDCCLPKDEGGLGLRDLCQWNTAACLFHLWRISQPSPISLWIMWFKRIFFKRKALWTATIPSSAPWCVRKILQLRSLALRFIRFHVGPSSQFLFWHDPWINGTSLLQSCHRDTVSCAESTLDALVGQYIFNSSWNLPPSNHMYVIELRQKVSMVPIASHDKITWNNIDSASVTTSLIWNSIRSSAPPSPWSKCVWFRGAIPKCAFTLWLALKGRLLTKDRMLHFQMNVDLQCVLCHNSPESHAHLFTLCPFTKAVLHDPAFNFLQDWNGYSNGLFLAGNSSAIRKRLHLLYLANAVYLIWKERNDRLHNVGHRISAAAIKTKVKRMVRERLHSSRKFQQAALLDHNLIMDLY